MTLANARPMTVQTLSGTAHTRGLVQAMGADSALRDKVAQATAARVQVLRNEGRVTDAMLTYVATQHRFHRTHDPDGMAELAGIAEGFGLPEETLFLHLHLGTLRDLTNGAILSGDGCSAFAAGDGPDGPFLAKNRDFGGVHLGVQRLFWHDGPDIATGGMLCLGSLGSPGAYSSGMNAAGLAIADTQIGARHHGVGWLRYMAMTRLLATCASVAEALDWLRARPHAGGGSLILADASGATAAVELGASTLATTTGARSWRTNHFLSAQLAQDTLLHGGATIDSNSAQRLGALTHHLSAAPPTLAQAAHLLALHPHDPQGAPVCQHPNATDDTSTLSSIIFAIASRRVYFHNANPCAGNWHWVCLPE
ncbi:C45 family autoproteolytic acyltransferase/hydrolase [Salinarimonas sp. NSM]|uniref:C45 family autoproteolytic acyltransferase/hydolase n=1 Tax=Alphaproteobacteria TaxID=28211 RepID=UPI004037D354